MVYKVPLCHQTFKLKWHSLPTPQPNTTTPLTRILPSTCLPHSRHWNMFTYIFIILVKLEKNKKSFSTSICISSHTSYKIYNVWQPIFPLSITHFHHRTNGICSLGSDCGICIAESNYERIVLHSFYADHIFESIVMNDIVCSDMNQRLDLDLFHLILN